MLSSEDQPFYFQPPWNVLFELHKLQKITPWEVNISFLLTSFLKEMEKNGEIDFRASGVALDSSSTIYLMKSQLLLKLEEPLPPPRGPPDFVPPPLFIPLRYELTSTTIDHLLKVLNEVLTSENPLPTKPHLEPILPPPELLPPIDLYLMEIEERMEKLYTLLKHLASEGKIILFSKVSSGLSKLESIKTFIILLFLAQRGKVGLWQEKDFGELYVTLMEAWAAGGKGTEFA